MKLCIWHWLDFSFHQSIFDTEIFPPPKKKKKKKRKKSKAAENQRLRQNSVSRNGACGPIHFARHAMSSPTGWMRPVSVAPHYQGLWGTSFPIKFQRVLIKFLLFPSIMHQNPSSYQTIPINNTSKSFTKQFPSITHQNPSSYQTIPINKASKSFKLPNNSHRIFLLFHQ